MQKEMEALNLLYDRQRKQYQIARRNVQIINRKCHELKVQIADLRRLQPDEATVRSLDEAEQAARMYDANAATGNEVLDVVLTEKSLLCESQRIRLNCVADGACLAYVEPGGPVRAVFQPVGSGRGRRGSAAGDRPPYD